MRTSTLVLPRVLINISENTARKSKAIVQYFKEDPDRIVGWGMLVVASVGQVFFGIFW